MLHVAPLNPGGHLHLFVIPSVTHVPPLIQTFLSQSDIRGSPPNQTVKNKKN